ncbi:MAG: hypothetical protein ACR2P9_04405 [Gammaproteobacteria bacterium]
MPAIAGNVVLICLLNIRLPHNCHTWRYRQPIHHSRKEDNSR